MCLQLGVSPLHYEAGQGDVEAVKLMLSYGANPNAEDFVSRVYNSFHTLYLAQKRLWQHNLLSILRDNSLISCFHYFTKYGFYIEISQEKKRKPNKLIKCYYFDSITRAAYLWE